jgi:hypothetical protein
MQFHLHMQHLSSMSDEWLSKVDTSGATSPLLSSPISWGWRKNDVGMYEPHWTTLQEAAKACYELLYYGCIKVCRGKCKYNKKAQGRLAKRRFFHSFIHHASKINTEAVSCVHFATLRYFKWMNQCVIKKADKICCQLLRLVYIH